MDILAVARQELARSKAERDPRLASLQRRQAAEKAWLGVVRATDDTFGLPGTGKTANLARRRVLRDLDASAGTLFLDEFERYQRYLHGACFYECDCPEPETEELIALAGTYERRLREARERAP